MKKTVLLVISIFCLIFLNQPINAQEATENSSPTDRGKMFVSPNIGYTSPLNLGDGISVLDLSLNMDEGYFICKNLAVTVRIGGEYNKMSIASTSSSYSYYDIFQKKNVTETSVEGGSSSSTFLFNYGAGLRYYIAGKVFLGASLISSTTDFSNSSDCANFQLGYSYFLKNHLALEASAGYLMGIGDASGYKALQGKLGIGFYF